MQRKPIIAGNWKMNNTITEAVQLVTALKRELFDENQVEVVVCPTFTSLSAIAELIEGSQIVLGAQNIFWEAKGAYTGEIAPNMLLDVGCTYVIIGHSERRKYFGETDESVNKKIKAALANGLHPIICVGETKEQREQGVTKDVIKTQISGALVDIKSEDILKSVIAYEPVWAIGTGLNATPEQAEEVHDYIRNTLLKEKYDETVANKIRIQYGGSVKPDNVKSLMAQPDIDGALVGGASLKVDSFTKLVRYYT